VEFDVAVAVGGAFVLGGSSKVEPLLAPVPLDDGER
jgi:hypothetical protein